MELSEIQKEIVTTTAHKVVVVSAAASGKTATITARAKWLLDQGENPKGIVLLTFTNAAAEEIADRLNRPQGLFIGTIHGYANRLLMSHGIDTSDIISKEEFNKLFSKLKRHPECIQNVNHLILDESQDSNPEQFEFLLDMIQPNNYMLCGDHRQSIYRWNGSYPDYLLELMRRPDVTTYELYENYRNAPKILDFARSIITTAGYDYIDDSVSMRNGVKGRLIDVVYNPKAIAETVKKMGNFGSWFILTRTNDQIDTITRALAQYDVPYDTFKRSQFDNKELNEVMKRDTVKVLTIHSAKGLENDNVIVIGAKFYNIEEKCVSYVAATRARNLLVWARMPSQKQKLPNMNSWEI